MVTNGTDGYTTPLDGDVNSVFDFQEAGAIPSITTQPTDQTICIGDNGSFTVVASGSNLIYQWQLSTNGGATFNDISDGGVYAGTNNAILIITGVLAGMDNNQYRVIVGNSAYVCGDVTSNAVTLTVPVLPAAPTSGGDITECEQSPIQTLTATATAPVGSTVVWYNAPTGGSSLPDYLDNFDTRTCNPVVDYAGSNGFLDWSSLLWTENGDDGASCAGDVQVQEDVLGIEPGNNRLLIGVKDNGVTRQMNLSAYSTAYLHFDYRRNIAGIAPVVSVEIWDDGSSSWVEVGQINNGVDAVYNHLSYDITAYISANTQVRFTSSVTFASTDYIYLDNIAISTDAAYTYVNPILSSVGTVTYYAESVDGTSCTSSTRTAVTLTIEAAPAAPTSSGDQIECEESPIQTLTATASAPAGSSVVWYDAATGGNVVASPTLNTVGTIIYYAESVDGTSGCTSLTRTEVNLTIGATPTAPVSGGDQTQCEESPIQTLTAVATPPAGSSVVWYYATTGGSVVASPILNSVGTITYYAESENSTTGCISISRTAVTLTIEACTADLSLTKTVDNTTPDIGDTLIFSLVITNSGPSSASGVSVGDILQPGLSYVSSTATAGSYNSITGIWDFTAEILVVGDTETLTITATIDPDCDEILNRAEIISSNLTDPDSTPNNGG